VGIRRRKGGGPAALEGLLEQQIERHRAEDGELAAGIVEEMTEIERRIADIGSLGQLARGATAK